MADNTQHNIMTLLGQVIFHGIRVIAISTPDAASSFTTKSQVVRRQQCVRVNELVSDKGVPITSYFSPTKSIVWCSQTLYLTAVLGKGLGSAYTLPILERI